MLGLLVNKNFICADDLTDFLYAVGIEHIGALNMLFFPKDAKMKGPNKILHHGVA